MYAQHPANQSAYHPENQPAQGSGPHAYTEFSEGSYGGALTTNPQGKPTVNGPGLNQGDNYLQDGFPQQHSYDYSVQGYAYPGLTESYPPVPSDVGLQSYSSNEYNQVPMGQFYGQAQQGPEPVPLQLPYQPGQAAAHDHGVTGAEQYVPYEYPGVGSAQAAGYGGYNPGQYSQEMHSHSGQMNWSPYAGYGGGAYGIPQAAQVQQHPGQGY